MSSYVHGITNCTYFCNDFDAMVRFYRDTLEMEHVFTLRDEDGKPTKTCLKVTDRQFIVLLNQPHGAEKKYDELSCSHVAITVPDIFAHTKALQAKGLLLTKGPSINRDFVRGPYVCDPEIAPCGSYTAWVQDPEGNELEFMQYTPASMQVTCHFE